MKLESQVTSLELSKRLHELGIKKKSIFVWEYFNENCYAVVFIPFAVVPDKFNNYKLYPAYTVAELGEMLPSSVASHYWLKIINWNEFDLSYEDDSFNLIAEVQDSNEANARAKMLIYLLENDLLTLEIK